jgi:hypothetical protein
MKRISFVLVGLMLIFLQACSGSETYRGLWKATNSKGEKLQITFDAKSFSVKDSLGETSNYEYTQNSVSINNSIETYRIKLSDGRGYFIKFPIANDESRGIIKDAEGKMVYMIGRNEFIYYEDIYEPKAKDVDKGDF